MALNRLPGPRLLAGWPVWLWLVVVLLGAIQLGGISLIVGQCLQLVTGSLQPQVWAISGIPARRKAVVRMA